MSGSWRPELAESRSNVRPCTPASAHAVPARCRRCSPQAVPSLTSFPLVPLLFSLCCHSVPPLSLCPAAVPSLRYPRLSLATTAVNYGLLMVADAMFGTHWQPGDPAPKVWSEAIKIWEEFGEVSQQTGAQPDWRTVVLSSLLHALVTGRCAARWKERARNYPIFRSRLLHISPSAHHLIIMMLTIIACRCTARTLRPLSCPQGTHLWRPRSATLVATAATWRQRWLLLRLLSLRLRRPRPMPERRSSRRARLRRLRRRGNAWRCCNASQCAVLQVCSPLRQPSECDCEMLAQYPRCC